MWRRVASTESCFEVEEMDHPPNRWSDGSYMGVPWDNSEFAGTDPHVGKSFMVPGGGVP